MSIVDQRNRPAGVLDMAAFPTHAGYELSIIVPTLNERENLRELSVRLECALRGIAWQAIIVDDDSGDGTASAAKALAVCDARFSCLRRVGRRGLAGAVIEGAMASAAPFIAVLDADLQHDEGLLAVMLESVRDGEADIAVASRFLRREDSAAGLSPLRRLGSLAANGLARRVLGQSLSDPMSGFFVMRRSVFDETAPQLSPRGFKILFDLLATRRGQLTVREFPYAFKPRVAGASKLDHRVTAEFLGLVLAKTTRNLLSPRAAVFLAVGASGLIVHLAVLRLVLGLNANLDLGLGFPGAQTLAGVTAMTSNFLINNSITYRDRRLRGWALAKGYVRFSIFCGLGLVANVAVATMMTEHGAAWWMAGVGGAVIGAAWNYLTTSVAVW